MLARAHRVHVRASKSPAMLPPQWRRGQACMALARGPRQQLKVAAAAHLTDAAHDVSLALEGERVADRPGQPLRSAR